ncbi:MAG: cobaltochelatase subunit CobN, partial [Deltaproteobacteria bacterium]|nr:cobaltochelatase subunit CobN [Deltaproteobacteria bacterium]
NMIYKVAHDTLHVPVTYQPPEILPPSGLFYPGAPHLFATFEAFQRWYRSQPGFQGASAPWVGVMIFKSSLGRGQKQPIQVITRRLEANGFNVCVAFGMAKEALKYFLDPEGTSRVDAVLAFSMKFQSSLNDTVESLLARLDVPVFNAISLYGSTIDAWRKDPKGIPLTDVVWCMANPEISGQIEPTPLIGKVRMRDEATGREYFVHRAIPDNLDTVIARLKKWIALQRKPNREKRVAILFYNHSQGKQNIGASYLNVFKSLKVILARMRQEGYRVTGDRALTQKGIRDLILKTARNIGSWAPGELDAMLRGNKVIQIPIATYKRWFNRLPEAFREGVIKQWGPVEKSKIMIHDGKFVVPSIVLGNVVLLPEPSRGWGDDPMKLYHSPTLYPHHQYVAVYLWLKYGFHADAMIHLGTHATHEWLPGKQAGLTPADPPEVLITDIPNIYPYIVDDVGEGIQAKRRGRGVIIDHMIPAVKGSGLYREYSRLYDLIQTYNRQRAKGSAVAGETFKALRKMVKTLGIDADLELTRLDGDALEKIEHYLIEMKETMIPYGLHTFGVSPEGEALKSTAAEIVKQNSKVTLSAVTKALTASGPRELRNLIRALNGRFIPAGEGNDPIRNPSAIPTGKDFYGFDPQKIPSKAAWVLGKKAAEKIIRESLKTKGTYPRKVAVILWATETIRNEGINESTILYLLGLTPVWDPSGRVVGTRVIPGRVLKRPRIDVLVNPSGLYRDLFPNLMRFIDTAVRKAMVQRDVENFIAENTTTIEKSLTQAGVPAQKARALAKVRIFSEKPGAYGTGVSETAKLSGVWKSSDEIVGVYKNHVGFAYGGGMWGAPAQDLFQGNLAGVDTVVHSMSSSVYGTMDNDDVFQYVGGMTLAVKKATGKDPSTVFTLSRTAKDARVQDASRVIGRELRTRYLNPRWIKAMKKEGYAGARAMSDFMENMWGWQVTIPKTVGGTKWRQAYEVYVKDKYGLKIKDFMERANPWAYQSMTARMLEAVRKGYWKAGDAVVKSLALQYAVSVVEKGVACCDHTCNNPLLNQMVVGILSLPGVTTPQVIEQFKLAIERMAKQSLEKQVACRIKLQKRLAEGFKRDAAVKTKKATAGESKTAQEARGKNAREIEGYKMEEIKRKDTSTKLSSSGVQWYLSFFILLIVGLFVYGVRKGTKK